MNILAFSAKKTTKFDLKITSNSIAIVVGDYIEALVLQQFHYWIQQECGVVIRGMRWIYKSIRELIIDAFPILTPWKLNKAIVSLVEKGFLLREHLFAEHHGHNFFAENRTYYMTVNYAKFKELEAEFASVEDVENNEDSRFSDFTETDSKYASTVFSGNLENITENTSTENIQRKIPLPNPSRNRVPKPILKSKPNTNKNTNRGGGDSPISSNSKPYNHDKGSQPKVDLSQVIARPEKPVSVNKAVEMEASPARVDYKVNNWYVVTTSIPPVQVVVQLLEPVPELVPKLELEPEPQAQQQEPVQSEVVEESVIVDSKPEPEPKSKRQKTPKGTKPKKRIYENALWESEEEKVMFRSDLTAAVARGVGNARNNMALVTFVVHQIDLGHSHIYYEEWKAGIPIGTSERQEWEAAPSKPYPMFVEYLAEKLKDKNDSREMALNTVVNILKDKLKAGIFWRDFKRVIEGLRQDFEKAVANGLPVALPVWLIERADISVERAGESATVLAHLAPEQIDWVIRGLPESEKLLNGTGNLSLPGAESAQETQLVKQRRRKISPPDPWLDEDEDSLSSAPKEQIATTNYITELLKKKGLAHLKGFKEKFEKD